MIGLISLKILADLVTLYEVCPPKRGTADASLPLPVFKNFKVAWVGDANNISRECFFRSLVAVSTRAVTNSYFRPTKESMLVTFPRVGIDLALATPPKYKFDEDVVDFAVKNAKGGANASSFAGAVTFTPDPAVAVRDADVIVTDTWISMGQEDEKKERLAAFAGYQVTEALAKKGGAKPDWKFLHCLPRKHEEVDDEVFYNPKRSIVWQEAENRWVASLWICLLRSGLACSIVSSAFALTLCLFTKTKTLQKIHCHGCVRGIPSEPKVDTPNQSPRQTFGHVECCLLDVDHVLANRNKHLLKLCIASDPVQRLQSHDPLRRSRQQLVFVCRTASHGRINELH